jgi:hypothetical protein
MRKNLKCLICGDELYDREARSHFSEMHKNEVIEYMNSDLWDRALTGLVRSRTKRINIGNPGKKCHICGMPEPESYDKFGMYLIYCGECKQYACLDHMKYKCHGCHTRVCVKCEHDCPDRHMYTG